MPTERQSGISRREGLANDNAKPVTLDELSAASGIDTDTLLQRLAGVLVRREEDACAAGDGRREGECDAPL